MGAAVPETAVRKDGKFPFWKHKVRVSWQTARTHLPAAQSCPYKSEAQLAFRGNITVPLYGPHVFGTLFRHIPKTGNLKLST